MFLHVISVHACPRILTPAAPAPVFFTFTANSDCCSKPNVYHRISGFDRSFGGVCHHGPAASSPPLSVISVGRSMPSYCLPASLSSARRLLSIA